VGEFAREGFALLALLLVVGWYLSYSAARLDRLHHRVETTRAALDAQLARRAAAAVEAAPLLDPATALLVADAATRALAAGEARTEWLEGGEPAEELENDLTRALHAAFGDPLQVAEVREAPFAAQSLDLLAQACIRVQLARRFHNDAVAQAVRVRRKPVVRWARLAGHASLPVMVEIDDSVPAGLAV
jgi:type VI protein secretion system component VasK